MISSVQIQLAIYLKKDLKHLNLAALHQIKEQSASLISSKPNPEQFTLLDDRFHRCIASGCSNMYFRTMLNHIFDQNMRIRALSGSDIWERHIEAAREHIQIIDFILNNNCDRAGDAMAAHLKGSKEMALNSLSRKPIGY